MAIIFHDDCLKFCFLFQLQLTSTTGELSCKRQKMNGTDSCVSSASKQSEDADLKLFDKLFVELVAESTSSDDPKLADAMKWFKRASIYCQVADRIYNVVFVVCF